MIRNLELKKFPEPEKKPETIEEVKVLISKFLDELDLIVKNQQINTDTINFIKDKKENILTYLQDIREKLQTQQKSGVVSLVTSNEISKTLSYEENRGTTQQKMDEKLEELIVHWARFCNDIGKSFSNHETYVNYIQRMRLSLK